MKIINKLTQYILPLALACWLLSHAYRGFQLKELSTQLQAAKFSWLVLAMVISLASHVVRAYRWQLLLQTLGFKLSLFKTFIALMVGHISNLLAPRLGEIVRCSVLSRTTGIPTSTSLGTVVAERVIDLASLIAVVSFTLAIAFTQLSAILYEVTLVSIPSIGVKALFWGSFLLLALIGLLLGAIKHSPSLQGHPLLLKGKLFLQALLKGFYSIKLLSAKNTLLATTVLMWGLYYFIGYVGVFTLAETSGLDWVAGMSILVMSSISITLPIQGAVGAYHWLVSSTLVAYGISRESSMLYVTLMYSAQLLTTLILGGLGIVFSTFMHKKAAP